ncbi:MAG TPA: phosphatase PAP2 family protein [Bdellovibrionales bacterium]|nr:phosphatase PAP2 family protein [Bdellovibrionales bacterium]
MTYRRRIFRAYIALSVFFTLIDVPQAHEAEIAPTAFAEDASYKPVQSFLDGFKFMGDRESQATLAIGTGAFFGARLLDEEARDYFGGQQRIGNLSKIGNDYLGTAVPGALLAGGLWAYGEFAPDPFSKHAGQAQFESLIVTILLVSALKAAIQRNRPDGSDDDSFPSAHTAMAFSTATVLNEFYGWKWGVPAFMLAGLTAAARMQDNRHWLSDTVGGATIAILVGRAFSRSHLNKLSQSNLNISPTFHEGGAGLVMRWEF